MLREPGPEIFFQSHPMAIGSLIVPSGSLDDDPSNKMLSAGKVTNRSGPAMATGGLLASFLSSFALFAGEKYKCNRNG